jgi:hypothetical protein
LATLPLMATGGLPPATEVQHDSGKEPLKIVNA